MPKYPDAVDRSKVGKYPYFGVGSGGGYVWDEVLEYRVWCHPKDASDDYFYAYASYDEAKQAADSLRSTDESLAIVESPLALILQRERIDEPESGVYVHITEERLAAWPPEFLSRPKRTPNTIADFLAPDAPSNRLDIIRGLAIKKR